MKQIVGMLAFILFVITVSAFVIAFWGAVAYAIFWAFMQVLSL